MDPGIYRNMPDSEYRAIPALSNSDLSNWLKPKRLNRSSALVGSAFHAGLLLGPDFLRANFVTAAEDFKLNTKEGKAYLAEQEAAHPGKEVLRPGDGQLVRDMLRAVPPKMRAKLYDPEQNEVVILGRHKGFDTLCKGKLDVVRDGVVVDVKTSAAVDQAEFLQHFYDYSYHRQAWFYASLYASHFGSWPRFGFAVFSKAPPHNCWYMEVTGAQYAAGGRSVRDLMTLYERDCHTDLATKAKEALDAAGIETKKIAEVPV